MNGDTCGDAHGAIKSKIDILEKDFNHYVETNYVQQIKPLWEEIKLVRQDYKEDLKMVETRFRETSKEISDSHKSYSRIFIGMLISLILTLVAQTNVLKTENGQAPWKPYWLQDKEIQQTMKSTGTKKIIEEFDKRLMKLENNKTCNMER